ncbi:MAG TPA: peptidylprolyl isomerase [bacterium]|nr:peptidylprolyl isomerase [bacterium]
MRNPWFKSGLAALGLWGCVATALAVTPRKIDQIYLVVDQDAMTKGEMDEEIAGFFMAQGMKPPSPGSADYEKVKEQVRDAFVREVLLAEAADRENVEVPDSELQQAIDSQFDAMKKRYPSQDDFEAALKQEGITSDDLKQMLHDQLQRRLKANRMLQFKQHQAPGASFVSDEEVQAYYRKHPHDFDQIRFSLILFRIPPKSKPAYAKEVERQGRDLLDQLRKGADFAAFAKKYSEDPVTAEKGGRMEPVYRADLTPKMADGLFALSAGSYGMVRSEDGVYLVHVESKKIATLDSVSAAIKDHLRRKKQAGAFDEWMAQLRKNATVLEDGKVVAYQPPPEKKDEDSGPAGGRTAGSKDNSGNAPVTSDGAAASLASSGTTGTGNEIYPTLPPPGLLVLDLGLEGFTFGNKDLSDFYGPGTDVTQGFPFGFGFDGALDLAVDPTLEVGLTLKGMNRIAQTVNFSPVSGSYTESWSAAAAGPGLEGKILIPLDESTNFNLTAGGGYYFLLGGGVTVTGSGITENANFTGSNFGGEAAGSVEFFLDGNMDSALDLTVGYRLLQFNPVTTNLTVNNGGPYVTFPSPLTNQDGSKGMIDFSGARVGFSLRFYLDKNN